MKRQILAPLDGSPQAETILPQAGALARATARELSLFMVEPMVDQQLLPGLIGAEAAPMSAHPHWPRSYLTSVAARLTAQGIAAQAEVVIGGDIAATILERARAPEIDLIAMATHGRTGKDRWIMGSVAEPVLHDAPKPHLLLPREAMRTVIPTRETFRTILVALDGSPFAAQALTAARALAETTGATLVLVAVAPTVTTSAWPKAVLNPYGCWRSVRTTRPACSGRWIRSPARCAQPTSGADQGAHRRAS